MNSGSPHYKPRVHSLSVSKRKGIPKGNVKWVELKEQWGIVGDAHSGPGHRQISLLAIESIKKVWEAGLLVPPGAFAENITTEGLDLTQLKVGDILKIGEALVEITQIGKECHNRCAIYKAVGDCVMPREGIFGIVLKGGRVVVGENIEVVQKEALFPPQGEPETGLGAMS